MEVYNAATYFVDRHLAEGRGHRVALLYEGQQITYAEVAVQVNRAGNLLKGLGVEPEDRVMMVLLNCPEFVYVFWGAMKAGAVPVPVNTLLRPADYLYLLNDSRATVCVVSAPLKGQIEAVRHQLKYLKRLVVVGEDYAHLAAAASPELAAFESSPDDAAFWLYSSGSTGFPKGTVHLHKGIAYTTDHYALPVLGITEEDRVYSVAPLFHAYGLGNALTFVFRVGAQAVLFPGRPTPPAVFDILQRLRPTLFFSTPTNFAALLAAPDWQQYDLSAVRLCVSAGEPLPAPLCVRWQERYGTEILDGIGSTEMLHIFISNRPGDVRPGTSGKVVPGYEARILDDEMQPVLQGEIGNLWVKGDSAAACYWNRHEKSKQTFVGEWCRTGDKYYIDGDGYYVYAGRSDDMLKVSGQWVSPAEVESLLMEHPAVLEAGVIGVQDRDGLVRPKAYVTLKPGQVGGEALARELQEWVKGRTLPHKYPRWIEFVPELPKTVTGKIQRFVLREMAR